VDSYIDGKRFAFSSCLRKTMQPQRDNKGMFK
jgi:hypothetical protein